MPSLKSNDDKMYIILFNVRKKIKVMLEKKSLIENIEVLEIKDAHEL